jgi:PhzF family phenazine biosynthesis protein
MAPLFQVDAFTGTAFGGNPAAVCLLDGPADAAWMQSVAAEMNLSETAFLVPRSSGCFDLRWFTPAVEVDLCGHATLASAHVLWEEALDGGVDRLSFSTRSGVLGAVRRPGGWIDLDFPATPADEKAPPPDLLEALGVEAGVTATNGVDWLVQVADEATVRRAAPDIRRLGTVDCRGAVITAAADRSSPADVVSRFFAPRVGIGEDPVTGSVHCMLGPWWASRLGRTDLLAHQASPRGGDLRVRVEGDRVALGGQAVTVLKGSLLV